MFKLCVLCRRQPSVSSHENGAAEDEAPGDHYDDILNTISHSIENMGSRFEESSDSDVFLDKSTWCGRAPCPLQGALCRDWTAAEARDVVAGQSLWHRVFASVYNRRSQLGMCWIDWTGCDYWWLWQLLIYCGQSHAARVSYHASSSNPTFVSCTWFWPRWVMLNPDFSPLMLNYCFSLRSEGISISCIVVEDVLSSYERGSGIISSIYTHVVVRVGT